MLLLVHQNAKPVGWTLNGRPGASFGEVLDHLRALARSIREAAQGPQPVIGFLDVSSLPGAKKRGQKFKGE